MGGDEGLHVLRSASPLRAYMIQTPALRLDTSAILYQLRKGGAKNKKGVYREVPLV